MNFDRLYRPKATAWRLCDASVLSGRPLVAVGAKEQTRVLDDAKWRRIRVAIEEFA